jgi:hypothetical protein
MKLDKRNVEMYNVTITSDEYPEVFELAVYLRLTCVIEMLEQRLGGGINWRNIINSNVSRDEVTLQFYVEIEYE